MHAAVDVRDDSGQQLAHAPRLEPVLTTRAYDLDRREIAARIEQIVSENERAPQASRAVAPRERSGAPRRQPVPRQPLQPPGQPSGPSPALRPRRPSPW